MARKSTDEMSYRYWETLSWKPTGDYAGTTSMMLSGGSSTSANYCEPTFSNSPTSSDLYMESPFSDTNRQTSGSNTAYFNPYLGVGIPLETKTLRFNKVDVDQTEYQIQTDLPTPSTLGWDDSMEVNKFYALDVGNPKEPYLELRAEYKGEASSLFPLQVYLDKVTDETKFPHSCRYPGKLCWKDGPRRSFRRPADLDRHYKFVHKALGHESFQCDHPLCSRHGEPFTRRDHCRDHYKDYHKEDLGTYKMARAGSKNKEVSEVMQRAWQDERICDPSWWRCSKCLDRVWIENSKWQCPRCNKSCEQGRIERRTANNGVLNERDENAPPGSRTRARSFEEEFEKYMVLDEYLVDGTGYSSHYLES